MPKVWIYRDQAESPKKIFTYPAGGRNIVFGNKFPYFRNVATGGGMDLEAMI